MSWRTSQADFLVELYGKEEEQQYDVDVEEIAEDIEDEVFKLWHVVTENSKLILIRGVNKVYYLNE